MKNLVKGVQNFQRHIYPSHRQLFEQLARGQSPDVLFITCADSRIDPSMLTQSPPGKLFVLRNAGNLVPDFASGASGEAATVAYAVDHLEVQHIVVCGHSACGAVTAVLQGHTGDVLAEWLSHADFLDAAVTKHWPELAGDDRVHAAVHLNAVEQMRKLRTHPSVKAAEAAGRLSLHAWVYEIGSGAVNAFSAAQNQFLPLQEVSEEQALLREFVPPPEPEPEPEPATPEPDLDHGPWTAKIVALGARPSAVADALAEITGLEPHHVHQRLSRLPAEILSGLTEDEARLIEAWMEDAGARVDCTHT